MRHLHHPRAAALAALLALAAAGAHADDGMWTFDRAPLAQIQARHGVTLAPATLAHLQLASVRPGGASGSLVSAQGLLLTNHHVVEGCLGRLSTPDNDLMAHGFVARRPSDERRCPGFSVSALQRIEDVTPAVQQAAQAAGSAPAAQAAARKAEIARLESGCSDPARGLRCEVVTLYQGARYHLYHQRQWDDVRLVWAPESRAGFFGGDPDNFVYPRFALDAALMRVYEGGRPLRPAHHLTLAASGPVEGELLFVSGHPGETSRLLTSAQLDFLREVDYPLQLETARHEQAALQAYARRSGEAARQAQGPIFGVENWLKASLGEHQALCDPGLQALKTAEEQRLREAYRARGLPGDPWAEVAQAMQTARSQAAELWGVQFGYKTMLSTAADLVMLAGERARPEAERLPAFRDAALPDIERRVRAERPFHAALEAVRLSSVFERSLKLLGADHPHVRRVLAGRTPQQAAEQLVAGTRLGEQAERERLLQGGAEAIAASTDPLIVLAREIYPSRRAALLRDETEVQAVVRRVADTLGQARFALYGDELPPDATGTLRLSFGPARGYVSNGLQHPWKTTWGGWWDRADSFDGRPPFDLPPSIDRARGRVDPRTPLDFVLTADIIGGNSGSPVVNARGEWVGLIFDGNLEGLGGAFAYQDHSARAIAVHGQAIVTALDKVYAAPGLAAELRGPAARRPRR